MAVESRVEKRKEHHLKRPAVPSEPARLLSVDEALRAIADDPEFVVENDPGTIDLKAASSREIKSLQDAYWTALSERGEDRGKVDAFMYGLVQFYKMTLNNAIKNLRPGQRVLTVFAGGCGPGQALEEMAYQLANHIQDGKIDSAEVIAADLSSGMIDKAKNTARNLNQKHQGRISFYVEPEPFDLLEDPETFRNRFQEIQVKSSFRQPDLTEAGWVVGYMEEKAAIRTLQNLMSITEEDGLVAYSSLTNTINPKTNKPFTMREALLGYGLAQAARHAFPDRLESIWPNPRRAKESIEAVQVESSVGVWVEWEKDGVRLFSPKPTLRKMERLGVAAGLKNITTEPSQLFGTAAITIGRITDGPELERLPYPVSTAFRGVAEFEGYKKINPFVFAHQLAQMRKRRKAA